jgi:hypothetical protein
MQSICDKEEQASSSNSSSSSSHHKGQLFRLLEDSSATTGGGGNEGRLETKRGRKLSEKILISKLTERSNKISSENELLFQMEDPQGPGQGQGDGHTEDGQKSKKRRTNQQIPTETYSLKLTLPQHPHHPLIRDVPVNGQSLDNPGQVRDEEIGKWISIKGLDSGGIKFWIPSSSLSL